jgi:hypothetical protein
MSSDEKEKGSKFNLGKRGLGKTHAPKKDEKEIRNQKTTLVLTKSEKEEIAKKAKDDGRSQTQFLIKFLYDHGALTK